MHGMETVQASGCACLVVYPSPQIRGGSQLCWIYPIHRPGLLSPLSYTPPYPTPSPTSTNPTHPTMLPSQLTTAPHTHPCASHPRRTAYPRQQPYVNLRPPRTVLTTATRIRYARPDPLTLANHEPNTTYTGRGRIF